MSQINKIAKQIGINAAHEDNGAHVPMPTEEQVSFGVVCEAVSDEVRKRGKEAVRKDIESLDSSVDYSGWDVAAVRVRLMQTLGYVTDDEELTHFG